jgi:hypothetical protein
MNKPNESRDTLMSTVIARLDENLREHFEERAAIMEFDAGLPRAQAECLALISVLEGRPVALGGMVAALIEAETQRRWVLIDQADPIPTHDVIRNAPVIDALVDVLRQLERR